MFAFLPHRLLRLTARLLLAVMLFAQMMVAAHACGGMDQPAPAVAAAMPSCHGEGHHMAQTDQVQPNLCAVHCTSNAQSADTHQVPVYAAPVLPVLSIALPATPSALVGDAASPLAAPGGSPPLSLLFGVLRC